MTLVTELLPDVAALQLVHPDIGAAEAPKPDGAWDTWHLLQAVCVQAKDDSKIELAVESEL